MLHASAPRGQQLLSPWLLGTQGWIQGPLPPASHPWSVQKTPCFLHTVDASALASADTESCALCGRPRCPPGPSPAPSITHCFPRWTSWPRCPSLPPLTLAQGLGASPAKALLWSPACPLTDGDLVQSRDGAGSLTPVYPLSLALGERRLGHLGIANGQASGV